MRGKGPPWTLGDKRALVVACLVAARKRLTRKAAVTRIAMALGRSPAAVSNRIHQLRYFRSGMWDTLVLKRAYTALGRGLT